MFEGILERVLQRALGDYIEGLDRKNLKLGVWSGNINLENVHVKKSIFQKFKLPLVLRLGRIRKLQIIVPWRSLSSSPVEVIIQGVNLIICPKSKEDWELIETFHTNFDLREQLIKDFALQIYTSIIKTEEAEQQEQGFLKNLVTKIIDNVQLTIQNMHVRLENYEHFGNTFSMGLTLKEIAVHTTNSQWQKEYFDRTKQQNFDKPVFKVLSIVKCGLYWRVKEDKFLARDFPQDLNDQARNVAQEDKMLGYMNSLFGLQDDWIDSYSGSYLLQPIQLCVKLKQVTQPAQLEKEAEFQVSLEVDDFGIFLQKSQYDNIVHLMELFNDYSHYQAIFQQTQKYKFLRPLKGPRQAPRLWLRFAGDCIRREIRQSKIKQQQFIMCDFRKMKHQQVFNRYFQERLEQEIDKLDSDGAKGKEELPSREYVVTVEAVDIEDLKSWAQVAATQIGESHKANIAERARKSMQDAANQKSSKALGGGILSYVTSFGTSWLGRGQLTPQASGVDEEDLDEFEDAIQPKEDQYEHSSDSSDLDERKSDSEEDEFFDAVDDHKHLQKKPPQRTKNLQNELKSFRESLILNFGASLQNTLKRKEESVPLVCATFRLKQFQVSLVDSSEKQNGIEIFSREFTIEFSKYEETSEANPSVFTLIARNEEFGINQLIKYQTTLIRSPLIMREKSNQGQDKYQVTLKVSKGNMNYKDRSIASFLIPQRYDFDISLSFRPIVLYYQLVPVNKLMRFLKVEDFKEDLRQQAYERFENFKQSVNISEIIQVKQKNRLQIDIASPILVIPFRKNNDILSECWIINMGTFSLKNYERDYGITKSSLELTDFNNFHVSISDIMVGYCPTLKGWIENKAQASSVINRFGYEFVMSLPKGAKKQVHLHGKMSELEVSFTPHTYCNLININHLLIMEDDQSEENLVVNDKSLVVKMSSKIGMVKVQVKEEVGELTQMNCILSGAHLYFYKAPQDPSPSYYYSLVDVTLEAPILQETFRCKLKNSEQENLVLEFQSAKQLQEWSTAINECALSSQKPQLQVQSSTSVKEVKSSQVEQINNSKETEDQLLLIFGFMIPRISIKISALKNDSQCSYNLGLFSDSISSTNQKFENPFKDPQFSTNDEESWSSLFQMDHIYIGMTKNGGDLDVTMELKTLMIEDKTNPRFPYIVNSQTKGIRDISLIKIDVKKKECTSPTFIDTEMDVKIMFGHLYVNWHPKSLNRLIRFLRFMKFEKTVIQQETDKFYEQNKKKISHQISGIKSTTPHSAIQKKGESDFQLEDVSNCVTYPYKSMVVNIKLELLQIILIHPINHTYPIATMKLGGFEMDYESTYDHDHFVGCIQDLQMFDNTNYPLTIDPDKLYTEAHQYPSHEILGPRVESQEKKLLWFDCIMFHKPLDNECIHQLENYDKNIKLEFGAIQFRFINEWIMRLNDYFFNQLLGAVSDANPFQPTIDKLLLELNIKLAQEQALRSTHNHDDFSSLADNAPKFHHQQSTTPHMRTALTTHEVNNHKLQHQSHSQKYHHHHHQDQTHRNNSLRIQMPEEQQMKDLNQQKSCAGITLNMNNLLLIIKDRPYLPNELQIDLGSISISSVSKDVTGRWKKHEHRKLWVTQFIIDMKQISFCFNKSFFIAQKFDLSINFEKPNYTPLVQDAYLAKDVDFTDVDWAYRIHINFSPLIMHLKQDAYQFLLRCNDLNFNYSDGLTRYFQLAIWNIPGEDTLKYIKNEEEIVRIHKNKEVYKMKVYLHYPSIALQVHNNKTSKFLTEMVLWNAKVEFLKYVDYRKTIVLSSHTFFILHSPSNKGDYYQSSDQLKQIAIAPVNSLNFITTDKEFYNFEVEQRVKSLSPTKKAKALQKYSKQNFIINMHMEPDGEKLIQVKIEKLKIFIKPHIYLMIFELFVYGMPQYAMESRDKPNYYDSDWGNAPKMEVGCTITQSLLCFENDPKYDKTIACQGNTSFTYIREKMNQIKKKLIEQPNFTQLFNEEHKQRDELRKNSIMAPFPTVDSSSTFKIMQVSISDLCPFFCHPNDLDGKNFKQVRKREMMSPFTLFFNKQDIIELQKSNERVQFQDRLVFKVFNKVEANLERTLLKISFNDIKVLKGIADHLYSMLNQEYMLLTVDDEPKKESKEIRLRIPKNSSIKREQSGKCELEGGRAHSVLLSLNDKKGLRERNSERLRIPISKEKTLKPDGDMSDNTGGHESEQSEKNSLRTESIQSSDDDEEEKDEYFDDEEQQKINMKVEKNKELIATLKRSSPQGKYSNKINNLADSLRRASSAYSMFQESYFQRNKASQYQSQLNEKESQYELIHQIHTKLYPSPEVKHEERKSEGNFVIKEEDEDDDFDVDEGDRVIFTQSSLDIVKGLSPEVTKQLLTQSDCLPINLEIGLIKEEKGVNQFQVVSYGLKILIINDSGQNFFPVLGLSLSEFHFSSDQNETQKAGQTQFSSAINYYNAEAGEWEPFIETFNVHITLMEEYVSQKKIIQLEVPSSIGINVTLKLVQNISETFKSWEQSEIEEDSILSSNEQSRQSIKGRPFALKDSNNSSSNKFDDEDDSLIFADRGGTQRGKKSSQADLKSQKTKYVFDDLDKDEDLDNNDREEEDVVTPYSICNHTNVKLLVKRLNNHFGGASDSRFDGTDQKRTKKDSDHHKLNAVKRQSQSKLNRVYVIKPDQHINYAVDYELQVKQQMNMYSSHQFSGQQGEFIKILFNDNSTEKAAIMNIPLSSVNLNQIGYKKHFVREDDPLNRSSQENEFYLYGVQQINMKKVLTIRTQYLFVNQTFFSYDIHIRFNTSSVVRTLGPGDKLPIPNSYNKYKFQIRISPLKETSSNQDRSKPERDNSTGLGVGNTSRQRKINESSLQELLKSGRDIPNFQVISKNWSDLLPIDSLKSRLPINRATFLKHGRTFSIIKKEPSSFPEGFDIVMRPPLLLKNCLPVPILIEYQDSNDEFDRLDLQKQEEKHVFAFNLQTSVMMKVIIEGFQPAVVVLECSTYDKEIEIKTTIYDFNNRPLDVYIHTSSKVAGRKAVFYVKNIVINNTEENLNFYYDSPSERQIKAKSSKEAVAGGGATLQYTHKRGEYFMLSDKHEIYAHIDGSLEVSNPINIFNPGCKDRFMLSKDRKLYEYSYSTEIFLATKDEYVYTKITTISPQYVIVNQTMGEISIAQLGSQMVQQTDISQGERIAFHWSDKDSEKLVCIKYSADDGNELDWTFGIPLNEVGAISVRNRQKMPAGWKLDDLDRRRYYSKFLRIERKYFKNTLFVLIEEENLKQPFYKIENLSQHISLRYFQTGFAHHADFLNLNESAPFAWTNVIGDHRLQVELFKGDLDNDETFKIQINEDQDSLSFPLDCLNYKEAFQIPLGDEPLMLYVWTFTDGFTKVIRFSDTESKRIDLEQTLVVKDENVSSLQMIDIYMKSINLSVIGNGQELFTLYLQGLVSKLIETETDRKVEFKIGYLQLDNQSENDPIYPVIIKPKYVKPDPSINFGGEVVEEESQARYQGRTNPTQFAYKNGVFELFFDLRKDIPNVLYFEQIQHQMQSFELKLEFSHILQISKFLSTVGGLLNKNLTFMHQIFDNDQSPTSPSINQDEDVSPGRRGGAHMGDTFTSKANQFSPQQSKKPQINTGVMAEKKLFFGIGVQHQDFEAKQQTIASSLNLLRNASLRQQHYEVDNSNKEGGSNQQHKGVQDGSPKRFDSLSKQKNQHKKQIIEKMRIQDNVIIEQDVRIHRDNWKEEEFKQQVSRIYIKRYDAGPIEVEVSVMNKANFEMDDNSDIIKTISSLGLLISSIDQAPIQLNALGVENIFGNQTDVIDQLKNHHTSQLSWNLLKLIGASNLLGNPMNFVNALGTGVQDFFYEPREGFTRGTIQGGIGIIKGTTSLVTNTFVGAIGSASKMAQSVSKGLLVLSNDTEYIYRRDVENIKNRPKNVLQGLRLGFNQAIGSIGSGIVGVVAQPIEETKKGGILGFFKGTVKGVAGLVVKPISGTLDFLSSTTEGIKNTSKKLEELQQDKRLRLPRPFYESEHIIREYDEFHAFWVNSLPRIAPQLSTRYFYDACLIESTDISWSVLILTQEHLALIHTELIQEVTPKKQNQKPPISIKWVINTNEIRFVEIIDEKLLSIGFESGSNNLPLNEAFITEKIKSKIEKIMKSNK